MANIPFNSTITGPNIENAAKLLKFSPSNIQGGPLSTQWAAGQYLISVEGGVMSLKSMTDNGIVTHSGNFTIGNIVKSSGIGTLVDAGIAFEALATKSGTLNNGKIISANASGQLVDSGLNVSDLDIAWSDYVITD